jgi:hypothetical protein
LSAALPIAMVALLARPRGAVLPGRGGGGGNEWCDAAEGRWEGWIVGLGVWGRVPTRWKGAGAAG